jgi:hypothetical protein
MGASTSRVSPPAPLSTTASGGCCFGGVALTLRGAAQQLHQHGELRAARQLSPRLRVEVDHAGERVDGLWCAPCPEHVMQ